MNNIRKATPDDAKAVEAITMANWNQKIDSSIFENQATQETCALHVATVQDQVVGFVSTFLSVDVHDTRRWEVDLLAVHPENHSKGYGTALIQSVLPIAREQNVAYLRGLVRTENIASQKAFQHAGYVSDGESFHLYLWPPEPHHAPAPIPPDITLLPLNTLTFRGLAIEGLSNQSYSAEDQRAIVSKAQNIVFNEKRANTGALIPTQHPEMLSPEVRKKGTLHGEYAWWTRLIDEEND